MDFSSGDTLHVRGSIVAANPAANCAQRAGSRSGGNVESSDDCLFEVRGAQAR